jgi:hypothetical protein
MFIAEASSFLGHKDQFQQQQQQQQRVIKDLKRFQTLQQG